MKTFPRFVVAALMSFLCVSAMSLGPVTPAAAKLPDPSLNIPREMPLFNPATNKNDVYKTPTMALMARAFIKLSGADLDNDTLIDEFASTNYCALINQFYGNEFKWKEVRSRVRLQIEKEMPNFSENILLHGIINVGRYDFQQKAFLLTNRSIMKNVGVFTLGLGGIENKPCIIDRLSTIPSRYIVRLTNPINLDAISVPEQQAAGLLKNLRQTSDPQSQDTIREMYISFFIRVNDFVINKSKFNKDSSQPVIVRSTLVAMRVYEDQERTKLVYEYKIDQ